MRVEPRAGRWWIVDIPDDAEECGPYPTKKDAERDMQGMKRFFAELDAGRNPFEQTQRKRRSRQ